MIKKLLILILTFSGMLLNAQSNVEPAMADSFRANGKIYVVITVIALIFISLLIFLIYLDRKISRLEKKLNNTVHNQ